MRYELSWHMYKITQIGRFEAIYMSVPVWCNWDEQNKMLAHGWRGEDLDGA